MISLAASLGLGFIVSLVALLGVVVAWGPRKPRARFVPRTKKHLKLVHSSGKGVKK